jgi:hypothetical protein
MKFIARTSLNAGAVLLIFSGSAWAAEGPPSPDRLTLMVSNVSLSGSTDVNGVRIGGDDGGGAAVGWLHNFSSSTIAGVGVEYETIGDSHWTFGSLSFAYGVGSTKYRSNFYADGHKGSGKDDVHSFTYGTYTVGLIQNLTPRFAVLIEDKQIDVDTTHGNLPKLGVQYLWNQKFLTAVSYSHSVSPDLGTRLWSARADYFGKHVNLIFGGAAGKATPVVLGDLGTQIRIPGLTTREGFVGIVKPFARMDVTLLADYIKIADIKRTTITLNGSVRLGSAAK